MEITDPRFHDADKAREYLEAQRWPNDPICPHCGNADPTTIGTLKGKAHRAGLYQCNACREQFTVTVGSVMERSKIPLNKWLMAMHLMGSSKKGISAHRLHRMLGVTYQTAWFLAHRIREAMCDEDPNASEGPLGGKDKVVEADETVIGGRSKNRAYRDPAPKKSVVTLVKRGGRARSKHVANIDAVNLRPFIVKNASRKSTLNTDEASYYVKMGREFAGHHAVDHSRQEYAYKLDGRTVSTNSAPRTISAFSSAGFTAFIIRSARRTCIVTFPSSIFATRTAQSSALRIRSASRRSSRARKASALLTMPLITRKKPPSGCR
jgi:transposase-like protein